MPERFYSRIQCLGDQSRLRHKAESGVGRSLCAGLFSAVVLVGSASAAETSYTAGSSLSYKFDDNIGAQPINPISLSGWILDGFINGKYATSRLTASLDLKLRFDRYTHASVDSDNPDSRDPEPEDYNSDNQFLKGGIAYQWERHALSLDGAYSRSSTLNTQFQDTGGTEGTGTRFLGRLTTGWKWQITEKQTLDTTISGQSVDYQSSNAIGYDYATVSVSWAHMLTERMSFQLLPTYSWFRNEADNAVKSNNYGLQAGFLWAVTEKWQFNLLAGGSKVYTEYGQGGYVVDPDTLQVEFVEAQDSSGFVGSTTLSFTDEKYGFNANLYSRVTPTGNGVLQQRNGGQLLFYWKPRERLRFDIDGGGGYSTATDDRIEDGRQYWQVGTRFAYQFLREWWLSARYRYRANEYDRSDLGAGRGNSVYITLSYRLPEEVF